MKLTAHNFSNVRKALEPRKGFTLIELLVVIGILAILLAITLIAINPAHQFAQANNTKRRSDVLQILNAIGQYAAENKGNLPPSVSALTAGTQTQLDETHFGTICAELVTGTPAYIPALPTDPRLNSDDVDTAACTAGGWDTGYFVTKGSDGRITVHANGDESVDIDVTR